MRRVYPAAPPTEWTKRDEIALAVLTATVQSSVNVFPNDHAKRAYQYADAMLKARLDSPRTE